MLRLTYFVLQVKWSGAVWALCLTAACELLNTSSTGAESPLWILTHPGLASFHFHVDTILRQLRGPITRPGSHAGFKGGGVCRGGSLVSPRHSGRGVSSGTSDDAGSPSDVPSGGEQQQAGRVAFC